MVHAHSHIWLHFMLEKLKECQHMEADFHPERDLQRRKIMDI